jgi:hypothetical protein
MDQELSARAEQVLERIGEDESLTSDLTDPAATALLDWITQQVRAADATADDAIFQEQVAAIRSAARAAAKAAAEDDAPASSVVERAQAALQSSMPASETPAAPAQPPVMAAPASSTTADQPSVSSVDATRPSEPRRSLWNSLRRQVRRWVHRKV